LEAATAIPKMLKSQLESLTLRRALFTGLSSALATIVMMIVVTKTGVSDGSIMTGVILNLLLNAVRIIYGMSVLALTDPPISAPWRIYYRWLSHVINLTWTMVIFEVFRINGLTSESSILALIITCAMISCAEFSFATMLDLCLGTMMTLGLSVSVAMILVGSSVAEYAIGSLGIVFAALMSLNAWQTYFILVDNAQKLHDKADQNALMRSMLNATPGFMTLIDAGDLSYIMVNDAFRNVVGKDIVGRVVGSVEHDQEFYQLLFEFRDSGARRVIREIELGNGEYRHHYLVSFARVDGQRPMISVLSINIEEQKKTELALAKARSDAEHSSRLAALGEMISSVAHEIRNPLTIISARALNLSAIARKGQMTTAVADEEGKKIAVMVDRIAKIIGTVLKFSRGDAETPMSKVKLHSLVDEVRFLTEIKCKTSRVTLKVDAIDPTLDMDCFPLQVSQVLVNLVNNAVDAIESIQGVDSKWIQISVTGDDASVELRVIDCGLGIPKEIRDKMLHPFFTTKPAGKGTGLGLSISRGIIEKHLGRLWIDDKAHNTTFVIEIPRHSIAAKTLSKTA
jgi:signal transduction histidine kinase